MRHGGFFRYRRKARKEGYVAGYEYMPDIDASEEERSAIRAACLDYIESWYSQDAERMRGCLHPDLDKRGLVRRRIDTRAELIAPATTTASGLIELTELGVGRTPPDDRLAEITILTTRHHLASAEVESAHMYDLLQLMRLPDGWKIVQSIWTLKGGVIANVTTDA